MDPSVVTAGLDRITSSTGIEAGRSDDLGAPFDDQDGVQVSHDGTPARDSDLELSHDGTVPSDQPTATIGPGDYRDPFATDAQIVELAAGIEHERRVYARALARIHDLRELLAMEEERRLEAFALLARFGRSPFVAEWVHHVPPSDPASCAAFADLVAAS